MMWMFWAVVMSLFVSASAYRGINSGCADFNNDQRVNIDDLADTLVKWGLVDCNCPQDVNGDGKINIDDLANVLVQFARSRAGIMCAFAERENPGLLRLDVNNDGAVDILDWKAAVLDQNFADVNGDDVVNGLDVAIVGRHLLLARWQTEEIPVFSPHSDGSCCRNREESPLPVRGCGGSQNLCFCDRWSAELQDSCSDLELSTTRRKEGHVSRKKQDEFPDPCCCKSRQQLPGDQCLPLPRAICIDENDFCFDTPFCCCQVAQGSNCMNATTEACAISGGICVPYPTSAAPTSTAPTPSPTRPSTCELPSHPALPSEWPADIVQQTAAYNRDVRARADIDGNGMIDTNDFNAWVLLGMLQTGFSCDMSCPLPRPDIDGDGALTDLEILLYLAPNHGQSSNGSPLYCL